MVIFLVILGAIARPESGRRPKNIRKDWRRRPDLNRGWRFCRPKQAPPNRPETANSLAFLPPLTARIRLNPPQKGSATGSAVFFSDHESWSGRVGFEAPTPRSRTKAQNAEFGTDL